MFKLPDADDMQLILAIAVLYVMPIAAGVAVCAGLVYGIATDIAAGLRTVRRASIKQLWPF
jgi:hypothetical protein